MGADYYTFGICLCSDCIKTELDRFNQERALSFLSPKKEDVGICAVLKKLQSSCCLLTVMCAHESFYI
jgi:hypothetical protein